MYNYAMAHIHYYKGDFSKALKFNNKIDFSLFAFKYDARLLQFKIYYELDYFNEAYSLIDTHKHFIANNKNVSDYYKEMHKNFLNYYLIITRSKEGKQKDNLRSLKKEITATNNIVSKHWLLDKIKTLEKS